MKINREQRNLIRKLHYKNEELMDLDEISYEEYLENNNILLRQVNLSILTNEQRSLLIEAVSAHFDIEKFRLGIKIAQVSFN